MEQSLARSKCSINSAAPSTVMAPWLWGRRGAGVRSTQQVLTTHCPMDGSQEGRRPGPPTVSSFQSEGQHTPLYLPRPLSQVRPPKGLHPPPPSACSPASVSLPLPKHKGCYN